MSGRKGMVHYTLEVKQKAVRLVLEEHLTYAEVARMSCKLSSFQFCIYNASSVKEVTQWWQMG